MRIIVLLGAALLTSCGLLTDPELPDGSAQAGVIVALNRPTSISSGRTTIHVKDDQDEECGIIYTIGDDTRIRRRTADGDLEKASIDALRTGRKVRVWATGGVVLTSCPGQAGADAVELLPH